MRLGTAVWAEGPAERRALVAALPGDPGRVVDLNRVERLRLAKLGEGRPEAMADALVPASLRQLLEGGPRALQRARQALAYAEKWQRRGGLPDRLAPALGWITVLPCLPRPLVLRRWDGQQLDRLAVRGPGASISLAQPTVATVGLHGGAPAGICLALEDAAGVVLGAWLDLAPDWTGSLRLSAGGRHRDLPLDAWSDLDLPALRPGEVLLAPRPHIRPLTLAPGQSVSLTAGFDSLAVVVGEDPLHPTVQ